MILPKMHTEWEWLTKTIYDPAVFWSMATALFTLFLVIGTFVLATTSYLPLIRARESEIATKKIGFAERFRVEMHSPIPQKIIFLAGHGFLNFVIVREDDRDRAAYFSIIEVEPALLKERMNQIVGGQRIIMTFEMDDYLLNPLQEIAHYEKKGDIVFEDVFRIFADYIDICFKNDAIATYIAWMRKKAGFKVWDELELLHEKIEIHAGRKPTKTVAV